MGIDKIRAILRECKNILSTSKVKVGFCDTNFYGWSEIKTGKDIDKISIIGRGGTDFFAMANSFSKDAGNKIVITDGYGSFPEDCPDILWVVVDRELPKHLNPNITESYWWLPKVDFSKVNFIFINENEICPPSKGIRLLLKK